MIEVVFENEHFVICDKASGVLSTPSRFEGTDARSCLGTQLQEIKKIQIFPIHRLDFEVSGLVMYAKSADAHRVANGWFEQKFILKNYQALTSSQDFTHIPENVDNPRHALELEHNLEFEWESKVLRGKKRAYYSPAGKPSLTLARFLGHREGDLLLWDLQPVTGRSHQLRFDLSRHGFPILGDKLYGSKVNWGNEAIALRAYKITFNKIPNASVWGLPPVIDIAALPQD